MSSYKIEYVIEFSYEHITTKEEKTIKVKGNRDFDFEDDDIQEVIDNDCEYDYVECKEDAVYALISKEWDNSMESEWAELPEEDSSDEWNSQCINLEITKVDGDGFDDKEIEE